MSYKEFYEDINNQALKSIYVLYGPETLLVDRMLDLLREKSLSPVAMDFNYTNVAAETLDFDKVYSMVEMLPVMDQRRLVILKQPVFLSKEVWSDKEWQQFLKLHSDPTCTTTTILWMDTIDKRKKSIKDIGKIGAVIAFDALEEADLNKWIRQEVKRSGKTITSNVAAHLIERSGYYHQDTQVDLYRMLSWIQTLVPMANGPEISNEAIDQMLELTVEGNVFKFIDAIFENQAKLAWMQLKALLLSGEAELKLLFMIQRHVRQLLKIKMLAAEGFSQASIADTLSIKPFVVKKSLTQVQKRTIPQLRTILFNLEKTDQRMKSSTVDATTLLEHAIFSIMV